MFNIVKKLLPTIFVSALAISGSMFTTTTAAADEIVSSIARGGLLYDKWYKVIGLEAPEETHAAWPDSNTNKSGSATQRCKACHGWDLRGVDGAYASGSYLTGITGLTGMVGVPVADIVAIIQDDLHGFSGMMDDQDYLDLANFVSLGQFDVDAAINPETGMSTGDIGKGEEYYNTVCTNCHGANGDKPDDMGTTLGTLANDNPWEIIQKIQNGQPGERMPAMRAFGVGTSSDILAYLQTMPVE